MKLIKDNENKTYHGIENEKLNENLKWMME